MIRRLRHGWGIEVGRRLTLYVIRRGYWRWWPEAGISRMSRSFCGGFHFYWWFLAVEYDHLSRRWMTHKRSVTP